MQFKEEFRLEEVCGNFLLQSSARLRLLRAVSALVLLDFKTHRTNIVKSLATVLQDTF